MWPDNETTLDLIGFRVHADLIRSVVTDTKLLPVTLGVFGDWGSGKTSIMKMLQRDLAPETYEGEERARYEKIGCLYFNGWLFEGYDDAKSAILTSILLQLGEHKRFGPKARDGVVSLLKSVNWMRLATLGMQHVALPALAAYLTGGASLIPSLAASAGSAFSGVIPSAGNAEAEAATAGSNDEVAESGTSVDWAQAIRADKSEGSPLDVRTFRERFARMLSDSDIECLVVLIDDLDRCSPERIVENLEAIKLFLNVDQTAFVIGADPRIVQHAIATRYKVVGDVGYDDGSGLGRTIVTDYLEKLIQVPYTLPRLSPSEVETYMSLLFCLRDLDDDKVRACLSACEDRRASNRYGVFGYADVKEAIGSENIPDPLGKSMAFCSSAGPLVTEGLKGNPRQVKRFLNAFVLRRQLADIAKLDNIKDDVLVKLMVLEYAQPKEFRELFDWQTRDRGYPKEIGLFEKVVLDAQETSSDESVAKSDMIEERWTRGFMRKWIAMEPRLADIDLRDYFWVARDKLESTLSGVSMVSPIVRQVAADLLGGNDGRRATAMQTVKTLSPAEVDELLAMLDQHIRRNLDAKNGYDGLIALIENDITGSSEVLAEILSECSPNNMPPALGTRLRVLESGKPNVRAVLGPAISKLASGDTRIGRAIKTFKSVQGGGR